MGKKRKYLLLISVALGVTTACTYLFNKSDILIFSHKMHKDTGAECLTCHPDIPTSEASTGRMIPTKQVCANCHDEAFMNDCAKCHTDPQKPLKVEINKLELNFSHKLHTEASKAECQACHLGKEISPTRDSLTLPGHKECQACHAQMFTDLQCSKCHPALQQAKLKPITMFSHKGNYLKEHRESALKGVGAEVCGQCHDQAFCSDCHSKKEVLKPSVKYPEALERQFIHRGDYRTQHSIDARSDQSLCLQCHGLSSCNSCHAREGVGRGSSNSSANPHPAGWQNDHGRDARRDILKCSACHDQGMSSNCIQCHQIGGVAGGVSPHPKGWESNLSQNKAGVCLACHK
ncbi:MAG: hypothetical protein NT056_07935 [Proteobacteria bacterium]|nr:hypothetical protein [Pseudomonadota bacterium]